MRWDGNYRGIHVVKWPEAKRRPVGSEGLGFEVHC